MIDIYFVNCKDSYGVSGVHVYCTTEYSTFYMCMHPFLGAHMQVIKEHAVKFGEEMNAKAIAAQLRDQDLIPEMIEVRIKQSESKENGNSHLLRFLKEEADTKQVLEILKSAAEAKSYGRMNAFAVILLQKIQQIQQIGL